ncbi:MAG TPA: HAD family hydrolase [Myxococcota bacterium]|nr:HAD family hydrolase [Myxococcota bacterium]
MRSPLQAPRGFLFDWGDTLVEELREDRAAGVAWLFGQAAHVPSGVALADVLARAERVRREVDARRIPGEIEMSWPQLMRLVFDPLGVHFELSLAELELGAWQRTSETREIPGAREGLAKIRAAGIPIGVVSNTSFGPAAIRHELEKHGLAEHLAFVTTSSEYGVRKPNALLFEAAAARLGVAAREIWFVGDRLDKDVAGAKAAGMTAVWFCANASAEHGDPARTVIPDRVAHSWDELVALAHAAGLARA